MSDMTEEDALVLAGYKVIKTYERLNIGNRKEDEGEDQFRLVCRSVVEDAISEYLSNRIKNPEAILVNILRGTMAKPGFRSLYKLYTAEELTEAAKMATLSEKDNNNAG